MAAACRRRLVPSELLTPDRAHKVAPVFERIGLRPVTIAAVGGAALAALAVAFVDRPAATWAHAAFHAHRAGFDALTHLVDPLLPLASIGLIVAALAAAAGARPGRTGRIVVTCCLSVILIVTLKDQAKYAFGRLWPETWVDNNPSWIGNGAYGFFPFHGGRGWASFPSGHTAVMSAPAAVLWRTVPRLRWVGVLLVCLVAVGLFGADYHFIGDMIAGIMLGSAVGAWTVELVALNWQFHRTEMSEAAKAAGTPSSRLAPPKSRPVQALPTGARD